jgi:hypothetical protein
MFVGSNVSELDEGVGVIPFPGHCASTETDVGFNRGGMGSSDLCYQVCVRRSLLEDNVVDSVFN